MQVEGHWKAAANLQLLLGETHPPARIEHPPAFPGSAAAKGGVLNVAGGALVDARNTANFRTTSYGGLQDPATSHVRGILIDYYRHMLSRIPLWRHDEAKREPPGFDGDPVKAEPTDQAGEAGGEASANGCRGTGLSVATFRALGILTQVHECVGERELVPWEFFAIPHLDDDEAYDDPIDAMLRDIPQNAFPLLSGSGGAAAAGGGGNAGDAAARGAALGEALSTAAEQGSGRAAPAEGQRLSLYPRLLTSYTGLYPGMAVGIIGEPFQRTARGLLTGVLLRRLVLPCRPILPWHVDRPLGPGAVTQTATQKPTRVHFCSGPFPRRDIRALLRAVTRQALHRGADLLVVGGPLIKPFEAFERELLPTLGAPFSEMLDGFVDTLEETLLEYYAGRPHVPHLKIVLVSHRDDVTQAPVLPTTMYGLTDTQDVYVRSNPCRIAVNGVHFAVCNEDVVGRMREVMVERWPTAEGSLRRVVETLVQSRWYTPVTELPMAHVDMKHFGTLRLDYVPAENELLHLEQEAEGEGSTGSREEAQRRAQVAREQNWDVAVRMAPMEDSVGVFAKEEMGEHHAGRKRVKREPDEVHISRSDEELGAHQLWHAECMPHVIFLPSTRPQFAYVTHRGVPEKAASATALYAPQRWATNEVVDESPLDDTAAATGVLVVNQEVWSRRSSQRFELRVAEVTIPDSILAAYRGATPANGVACGVLHLFNAE